MPIKKGWFEVEGDVEGHGVREVEVDQVVLKTTDGQDITLEPEEGDGDRYRVVGGPDDLLGHRWRGG